MSKKQNKICPVEKAGSLDTKLRRLVQNPKKLLNSYIKEGMTVLEIGCGPGFFTLDMAEMVGESGKIIAVDVQEGMLEKVKSKIAGTRFEQLITLHKCDEASIGISEHVDFVLLFYMVHEVPDKSQLFRQLSTMLKPDGQIFVAEPPFHVSTARFKHMLQQAEDQGLMNIKGPRMLFSKTAILKKGNV